MTTIAVIGAGLAGLTIARELSSEHAVTVFEKSRGVGGRMATRYAEGFEFDHGAQFFTAKSPAFQDFLQPLLEQDVVSNWPASFAELDRGRIVASRQWHDEHPHYVGTPRMNSIGKWLAQGVDVRLQNTVSQLVRNNSAWTLIGGGGEHLGLYEWVVFALPARQAATLLPGESSVTAFAEAARMRSCFALMLGFDTPLDLPWQAAIVREADISWVSVNSSKPGRSDNFCLVAHSTNAWADAHIDEDEQSVTQHLMAECRDVVGGAVESATYRGLQRWRFANIDAQSGPGHGVDTTLQLAACGDWFVHGRVEAAFSSAHTLVNALRAHI